MNSIAWWPSIVVLLLASGIDVFTRRIPNWLVIPFIISGLVALSVQNGFAGALQSLGGMGLALILFGIPCFLRGMGMGDLKLAAGVGAWIGPDQVLIAFVITGIVGGILAVGYAICRGALGQCLDSTNDLILHFARSGVRSHNQIRLGNSKAISIPYAPAIAIGTLVSFFSR